MKYKINGLEVSKLEFDTAFNDSINDLVYVDFPEISGKDIDKKVDELYAEKKGKLLKNGVIVIDGVEFSVS